MISKLFHKPIFTGFEPNMTRVDVQTACAWLFFPWRWKEWRRGSAVKKVEEWLRSYFDSRFSFTYDSGRSALYFALKAMGATAGDEVLAQGYTCVVVANAIRWTGATPRYVDVGNDFNMDPDDLKRKITARSKILIIQHTFGTPAKLDEIMAIAKEHGLKIIEDCAHSLGATYKDKLAGTFGDIGMFSFGSDKVISCVRGGALVTNNEVLGKKLAQMNERLQETPRLVLLTQLLHYCYFPVCKSLYYFGGKLKLFFAKKMHFISHVIEQPEKRGKQVWPYPTKFPNALACILLNQASHLEGVNKHRQEIAGYYQEHIKDKSIIPSSENSIFLRFPILVSDPQRLLELAKKGGIYLGDWYNAVIAPADADEGIAGYSKGECPQAEILAKRSINLPTHRGLTTKEADRVIAVVNAEP